MQLYVRGNVPNLIPFFIFVMIATYITPDETCRALVHSWVYLGLVLKITELVIGLTFMFMPRVPSSHHPATQVGADLLAVAHPPQ